MKAPSTRRLAAGLSVGVVIVAGLLSSVPLALWLWWAVPPLELYYLDAYYHATLAGSRPSRMTSIQWVYKSAPDRPEELATTPDVVAESPGNATDYRVPMQLSSEARKAGWTALMQGPREDVKAADLEPYLRSEFYGGRSFWRLFEPFLWAALFVLFAGLGIREWITLARLKTRPQDADYWRQSLSESGRDDTTYRRVQRRLILQLRRLLSATSRGDSTMLETDGKRTVESLHRALQHDLPKTSSEASAQSGSSTHHSEPQRHSKALVERGGFPPAPMPRSEPPTIAQDQPSDHPRRRSKGHLIFPGEAGCRGADERRADWDESRWID